VNRLNLWVFRAILLGKGVISLLKNKLAECFLNRFQEILDGLDALADSEEMEELNAQLEDVLFLMESIDDADADADEELEGALEEIEDLLDQYRETDDPEVKQKALELDMALRMARNNLQ